MVEKPQDALIIILPEDFKWLTGKIVNSSVDGLSDPKANGTLLAFDLGLFKRGEYVYFEALAEVPLQPRLEAGKILETKMLFKHRIIDTLRKVNIQTMPDSDKIKSLKKQLILPGVFSSLAAIAFFILLLGYWNPTSPQIRYSMAVDESNSIDVRPMLRTDGNIEVKDILGNLIEILPTEEFFYERKFRPRVITQKLFLFSFWEYVVWVSLFAFLILSVLTPIWQLWKANKLRKFLPLNTA